MCVSDCQCASLTVTALACNQLNHRLHPTDQQTSNQSNTAGWFDFVSVTMETSATALLDIQNAPNVRPFLQPYMLSLLNHCSQIAQF